MWSSGAYSHHALPHGASPGRGDSHAMGSRAVIFGQHFLHLHKTVPRAPCCTPEFGVLAAAGPGGPMSQAAVISTGMLMLRLPAEADRRLFQRLKALTAPGNSHRLWLWADGHCQLHLPPDSTGPGASYYAFHDNRERLGMVVHRHL